MQGNALVLSGYPQSAEIHHIDAYESESLTVSFWVRKSTDSIRDTPGQRPDLEGLLWKAWDTGLNRSFSISLSGTAPYDLYAKVGDGSDRLTVVQAPNALPTGTWVHVALVISPTSVALFVDGEEQDAAPLNGSVVISDAPIVIGRAAYDSAPERYFRGQVDEIRMFDSVLAPREIRVLATTPADR